MTHRVVGRWGEDTEQAGDAAPDAGEHSLALKQSSVLQLSWRIHTRSQQPILLWGQDEASTLRGKHWEINVEKTTAGMFRFSVMNYKSEKSCRIKIILVYSFTYSDSNNKVAEISQVDVSLCVVALLGQAGPQTSRSLHRHGQDGDGLNAGRLQRCCGRHRHEVGCVVVLTAGQLQLLTHWQLQPNTEIESLVHESVRVSSRAATDQTFSTNHAVEKLHHSQWNPHKHSLLTKESNHQLRGWKHGCNYWLFLLSITKRIISMINRVVVNLYKVKTFWKMFITMSKCPKWQTAEISKTSSHN